MNLKTEQDKFDKVKWLDSIRMGKDMCGTYEFCGKCSKAYYYPCARAMNKWANGYIRIASFVPRKR